MKIATTVLALAASVLTYAPAAANTSDATRILLVGDSVTQGARGDYTWRYFLDRQLREADVSFDFVGSSRGVFDNWNWNYTEADAYANPEFDQDHAAVYGGRIQEDGHWLSAFPVGSEIERHQPDVIVSMWGINDLGSSTTEQAVGYYRDWFTRARSADPTVEFVVGKLPYTWADEDVPAFNAGLEALAEELTTAASPITVVEMRESYTQAADSIDHVHPNTSGQQKIARMVAPALTPVAAPPVVEVPVQPVTPAPQPPIAEVVAATVEPPAAPRKVRAERRGAKVVVTWRRAMSAESYQVKCGTRAVSPESFRATVRTPASRCKVRAVNAAGASPWASTKVR